VWRIRNFIIAGLLTIVPWIVMQVWIATSPEAFDLTGDPAVTESYIENDLEAYYSSQPAQNFAGQVFLNNVRVAILAFAAGALFCVLTAFILVHNGANAGVAGGLFTHVGEWERFWGLILPHGLLEISAVIVAGVVIGLVIAFAVAGLIEGFVTGRPWPTSIRVGIGTIAFLAFWGWTIIYGRRADQILRNEEADAAATLRSDSVRSVRT
jgi:uncharacterized membrane protein SpoIIM required for sporulation